MKKIYLSILFIAVSFFANAQVCLKPTTYPNGSSFIVNGDFNNDGKLDVVDSRSDSMRTWFGDGSGNLTLGTTAHVPYSGNIITNDFNKDGNADIVLTNNSMSSTNIMLALGTGTGSFGTPATFAVGSAPMNMLSADFNADSNPDVAAMGENLSGGINGFSVLIGDGAGNFGTHTDYTVGMYTSDITGGDFNGDSKYDIAVGFNVGNGQGGKIAVFLGDGLGGFGTPTNFTFGGYDPYSLCVADFNQDGKLDIAGSTGNSNAVVIMTGNGAGSFSATTTYMLGKQCEDILSADFNSDGKADLATADVNANYVSVLIGNGAGNFTNSINFPDAFVSRTILSGDYDSDGKPDLVAGNTQGDNFMLFLNVPAPNLSLTSSNPSALCSNASATLTVSGATTYTWSTNSGVPSPRDSINPSDSSIIHIPGNYTVTQVVVTPTANTTYSVIAQTNGCADSASFSYNIVMPQTPNICMVSTDSTTNFNYNVIYWDKTPYNNVDSFIVYRKDPFSANYLRIGAVSKNSLSEFIDTAFSVGGPNGGNPLYSSWTYKLAIMDTCGNIGQKSPYHQSMFVQQSGSNFSWNAYTVEAGQTNPVTGYSFLRDNNNTGAWHVLVNTTGVSTTDPNYTSYPNGNWRVDAIGFSCTPTLRLSHNGIENIFNKAHSNTNKPSTVNVKQLTGNIHLDIYPNPNTGNFVIESDDTKNSKVEVYSLLGDLIYKANLQKGKNNIALQNTDKGTYLVHVTSENGTTVKKIVIE